MRREDVLPVAAIRYEARFNVNHILFEAVSTLRMEGLRVGGVLEEIEPSGDSLCARINVVDILSGKTARITQERGHQARGCKLDPRGLAEISHCVTDAIAAGADLIVINKFGRAESDGGGLLSCIADAVAAGIPVLTAVREPHVTPWRAFHGGMGTELAPSLGAVLEWCEASCHQAHAAG
jgi:nucleoside-triphosphatase THEP1